MFHRAALSTLLLTSAWAWPALGQGWGDDKPRNGACFYQDANFRGERFCMSGGQRKDTLPWAMNDAISSIEIEGDARVIVYRDSNRRGPSKQITRDVRDLGYDGLDDSISSIEVEGSSGGGWSGGGGSSGSPAMTSAQADRIVTRAYQDILERKPDGPGLRLYRGRLLDDGWSEQQVREALRNSPEYKEKNTMTRQKAEAIVRQAYLSTLGREPDAGSYGYVQKVLKDKWTQADVERELRKSAEYQQKR